MSTLHKADQHDQAWIEDILITLRAGKPIRCELPGGGRLHIDRLLPFLCIHIAEDGTELAARDVALANASYLVSSVRSEAISLIAAIADVIKDRFGAFLILDISELSQDRFLTEDAPFLPPFEVSIKASSEAVTAAEAFWTAVGQSEIRFRTPRMEEIQVSSSGNADFEKIVGCASIEIRFAPIYRQPKSDAIYPELRERLVAMFFDAGLQAFSTFIEAHQILKVPNHRALGRKVFIDAVSRLDRSIDEVASAFDFLLAVTPINEEAAFEAFKSTKYEIAPSFVYRPLNLQVDVVKSKLYSISFDHLEDPVLYQLYREKQQELDLQLSLISSRQTPKFIELGRALYGPVERSLLIEARTILKDIGDIPIGAKEEIADADHVFRLAQSMVASYRRQWPDFEVTVELRGDLPSGLMVSGNRLLIASSTLMDAHRVEPLLSHEIGVHLLTYFNGSAQGLRLFRSGLAGYEGMQEGLAVFAEYLSGGMTHQRLKLIAGRVVGCASMLEGATFPETFSMLVDEYSFSDAAAFNLVLRLYRGGGLAKDAIYLRGLLALLDHLGKGGDLEPFWMGKIAAPHFPVMQELADRGLLRLPAVEPAFLNNIEGRERLDRARQGMRPLDLIQPQEP